MNSPSVNRNLLKKVRDNVIGRNATFDGPFGVKKLVYCDYTASGKALEYIEKFILENVHPFYANTHTSTSVSGLQTSKYREEARDIIRKCVNAGEEDVVIFTGNGVTAAMHKIIHVLGLKPPKTLHTVVITGPYEHHSNILPWKETGVTVERVPDDDDGMVDVRLLEHILREYFHRGFLIIVSMSAASNVTGIVTNTESITRLIHKYGGLSFWDYATGAPYLKIDMNPSPESCKDAIFISPHKFVGGVGTPGLLIAKKKLFNNSVPDGCGGGTVSWVTADNHEYLSNVEEREEGGTPAIVESIRAGLVFQVKSLIGENVIMEREEELCELALSRWRGHPNLQLLGSYTATRLPIFSFVVFHPALGKYLHHNFVSALLNDLYGIQVRGGCACAGPYAQDLLDMDDETANLFVSKFLSENRREQGKEVYEVMKPGFARLNLPYFIEDDTVEFIINAIDTVASEGWKLLPLYTFDKLSGNWYHRKKSSHRIGKLSDIELECKHVKANVTPEQLSYFEIEKAALDVLKNYRQLAIASNAIDDAPMQLQPQYQNLQWFLQPRDVFLHILNPNTSQGPFITLPFKPRRISSTCNHSPAPNAQVQHRSQMPSIPQVLVHLSSDENRLVPETTSRDKNSISPLTLETKRKLSLDDSPFASPVKMNNSVHERLEETSTPVSKPILNVLDHMNPKYQISPLNISSPDDATVDKISDKKAFMSSPVLAVRGIQLVKHEDEASDEDDVVIIGFSNPRDQHVDVVKKQNNLDIDLDVIEEETVEPVFNKPPTIPPAGQQQQQQPENCYTDHTDGIDINPTFKQQTYELKYQNSFKPESLLEEVPRAMGTVDEQVNPMSGNASRNLSWAEDIWSPDNDILSPDVSNDGGYGYENMVNNDVWPQNFRALPVKTQQNFLMPVDEVGPQKMIGDVGRPRKKKRKGVCVVM